MFPTQALIAQINVLLAGYSGGLADEDSVPKVRLIKAPFTPGLGLAYDVAVTIPANFAGSTPKSPTAGVQQAFFDPIRQAYVVQLIEPVGGWHWVSTDATAMPQTIYGYIVTNGDGTVTWGGDLLPTPVELTGSGQAVDLPNVRVELPIVLFGTPPDA